MSDQPIPSEQREFRCIHCNGNIRIPRDLPPTTAPCPHCSGIITSPALERSQPVATMPPISAVPQATPPSPAPVSMPSAPTPIAYTEPDYAAPAPPPQTPEQMPAPAVSAPEKGERLKSEPPSEASPKKDSRKNPAITLIAILALIVAVILGAGALVVLVIKELDKKKPKDGAEFLAPPKNTAFEEDQYIRIGWQKEAFQVLNGYLKGRTTEEKLPYILGGESMKSRLDDFYGGSVINDQDTPADAFTPFGLSEADRKRGLFMMIYDQPPQFAMKEFFRPLATLEVQYGVDEADLLLSTLAKLDNFAMEPLLVHAFFKRTSDGLKLDWSVFAQTKYRTFQNFVELPDPGRAETFRVLMFEDVPDKGRAVPGTRTYRLADPSGTTDASRIITDSARINVPVDSEIGRTLNVINWRGSETARPTTRTATVELKWTTEEPYHLIISRFLCWEFLGLGGEDELAGAAPGQ